MINANEFNFPKDINVRFLIDDTDSIRKIRIYSNLPYSPNKHFMIFQLKYDNIIDCIKFAIRVSNKIKLSSIHLFRSAIPNGRIIFYALCYSIISWKTYRNILIQNCNEYNKDYSVSNKCSYIDFDIIENGVKESCYDELHYIGDLFYSTKSKGIEDVIIRKTVLNMITKGGILARG